MLIPLVHGLVLAGPNLVKLGSRLVDKVRRKGAVRTAVSTIAGAAGPVLAVPAAWARYRGARPELRGAPPNTVLALSGARLFQPEDFDALFEVCEALGVPADSLWVVIHHESRGDATALNPEPAAGLIQLTTYAKLPGFDTADKIRALIYQTAREQLGGVVRQLYERSASVVRGMTPGELLLFNFTPKFVGRPESTVISKRGEAIYDKNHKGFDVDGKGAITVGDVYKAAERIAAEAGGRRVTREGRVVEAPAGSGAAVPLAAPSRVASRPKPAPRPEAPPAAPLPLDPALAFVSGMRVNVPPTPDNAPAPSAPSNGMFAKVRDFVSGKRGDTPKSTDAPDATSAPAFVSRPRASLPQSPDIAIASPSAASGPSAPSGGVFDKVRELVSSQSEGGLLDSARGALSALTTGGDPIGPNSDPRGLLLAAAQAQALDPVGWTWVAIPGEDLEVFVPNDAFKATLGDTPRVRIPVSYADLRELCRLLGCVPATRAIVDAIYQRAQVRPKPVTLVQTESDTLRMNTVEFVLKHHAQLEQQLRSAAATKGLAAPDDSELREPVGKWWIFDPKLAKSKYGARAAVNYGWFRTSVTDPIQTPGGAHDDGHADYSQVARAVHRYARRPSTQEQVDLCDVYAEKWPELKPFIDVLR